MGRYDQNCKKIIIILITLTFIGKRKNNLFIKEVRKKLVQTQKKEDSIKIKEPFDKEAYKIKVDKEKLEEIKDLIDKKIEEYNYGENKYDYSKKIYDEKEQMIHNNIINKYEYRKYRQKVNNKVTTLPSIFIKASKFNISKEDNDKLTTKKTNKIKIKSNN